MISQGLPTLPTDYSRKNLSRTFTLQECDSPFGLPGVAARCGQMFLGSEPRLLLDRGSLVGASLPAGGMAEVPTHSPEMQERPREHQQAGVNVTCASGRSL